MNSSDSQVSELHGACLSRLPVTLLSSSSRRLLLQRPSAPTVPEYTSTQYRCTPPAARAPQAWKDSDCLPR